MSIKDPDREASNSPQEPSETSKVDQEAGEASAQAAAVGGDASATIHHHYGTTEKADEPMVERVSKLNEIQKYDSRIRQIMEMAEKSRMERLPMQYRPRIRARGTFAALILIAVIIWLLIKLL
jgi:hypothetical protein